MKRELSNKSIIIWTVIAIYLNALRLITFIQ